MTPDLNPYASPPAIVSGPAKPPQEVVPSLQVPSIALFTLALIWCGLYFFAAATLMAFSVIAFARGVPLRAMFGSSQDLAQGLVFFPSAFIVYGAWCMRRRKRYRVAVTTAIFSCIPFLSPMIFFGIPFGVWALFVLRRADVRDAFVANDACQTSAASNPT